MAAVVRYTVTVMVMLALGAGAILLPTARSETASAQYGGTWSSWLCRTAVMNQWVTGRACISTYQVQDPMQRYWAMWGDTYPTD